MSKQIAVVSGASSGIGAEIARTLAPTMSLILLGRSTEKLEQVKSELAGEGHLAFSLDLTDEQLETNVSNFFAENKIDRVDLLINNAGAFVRSAFSETTVETFRQQFETNFFGSVRLTACCLTLLSKTKGSQIINISSTLGIRPVPSTSAYSASKAAMINWSTTLALELAESGVRVNCISPGLVETPIHDFCGTKEADLRKAVDSMQPLGFVGQPKHIAGMVKHLCSEESEWTTGSNFVIDGGISIA